MHCSPPRYSHHELVNSSEVRWAVFVCINKKFCCFMTHKHTRTHTHVHTHTYTQKHTRTHKNTHAYTHTHIHILHIHKSHLPPFQPEPSTHSSLNYTTTTRTTTRTPLGKRECTTEKPPRTGTSLFVLLAGLLCFFFLLFFSWGVDVACVCVHVWCVFVCNVFV
jgi:hypothetical protein